MKFMNSCEVTAEPGWCGGTYGARCTSIMLYEQDIRRLLDIIQRRSQTELDSLQEWLNCSVLTRFPPSAAT